MYSVTHMQVAHAWVSLNATCSAAEEQFVALATWTAARRRPSATSVARVALYQLKRQVSAHALHASASGAAWLRRTRDAVHRSAQRGGRLLRRTGEQVRSHARSGREWVGDTVAQGGTWIDGAASSLRTQAAEAVEAAQRCAREHGLGQAAEQAWRSVKRTVCPLCRAPMLSPRECRSAAAQICTSTSVCEPFRGVFSDAMYAVRLGERRYHAAAAAARERVNVSA